jgi:hypothetical protein
VPRELLAINGAFIKIIYHDNFVVKEIIKDKQGLTIPQTL